MLTAVGSGGGAAPAAGAAAAAGGAAPAAEEKAEEKKEEAKEECVLIRVWCKSFETISLIRGFFRACLQVRRRHGLRSLRLSVFRAQSRHHDFLTSRVKFYTRSFRLAHLGFYPPRCLGVA
jgi:hypothetical protein